MEGVSINEQSTNASRRLSNFETLDQKQSYTQAKGGMSNATTALNWYQSQVTMNKNSYPDLAGQLRGIESRKGSNQSMGIKEYQVKQQR